jgi:hypothetical protein
MQKIYELMDSADSAYIMHKGKLTFEISPNDKYYLEGKEIIFGTEEPLIAYKSNRDSYFRFQTVYAEDGSSVDSIPLKNLYKVISTYNIGYVIVKNIAKFVEITNKMYIKKEQNLSGKDMASREFARLYVEMLDRLDEAYEKMKVKWVKKVVDNYMNSLVYTKGKAFKKDTAKSSLKLRLDQNSDYIVDLEAGALLCEEGDQENEMFILNRGNLEVYIGGKKVAMIGESGTVIGEMALLLGEKRTATIKALTNCNITIIKPENLKEVASGNSDFFLNVAVNMGRRLEHNCSLIRGTEDLLGESETEALPAAPKERTNYLELMALMNELETYDAKYKLEWLSDLLQYCRSEIAQIRKLSQ